MANAWGRTSVLLGIYFPGYSVSYGGSVVGFLYVFVVGYAIGRTIGVIYNRLVSGNI